MIRALIFDFDGVILETELPDYLAWQEIYHEHGTDLPLSVWAKVLGSRMADNGFDPIRYLEEQVGHTLKKHDRIGARQRERSLEMIIQQPVMPGVEAMISNALKRGLKLAVASSSPRRWVVGHLTRLGLLRYFDVVKTSDDVQHTKPDPELFLAALQALAINPDEAIVLEDSPNGIAAARAAGILAVAVPTELTGQLDLSHADCQISSLAAVSLDELIATVSRNTNRELQLDDLLQDTGAS